MLSTPPNHHAGFSLTELMIGSVIGLIVIVGALNLYSANVRATADNLRGARLNQELRGMLDMMQSELRRAGYWGGEPGLDNPADNPFQSLANDIQIDRVGSEPADSCVLYSYDLNGDKLVGTGPSGGGGPGTSNINLEQFGFRLRGGRLQLRTGGRSLRCDSGSWQALSDPDTEITALRFSSTERCVNLLDPTQPCASGDTVLLRRGVHIELSARSRSDTTVHYAVETDLVLANDKLILAMP